MSREDIAVLFPSCDKFILGMKLYKFIQGIRGIVSESSIDTSSASDSLSTNSSQKRKVAKRSSLPSVNGDSKSDSRAMEFQLPAFSLDIEDLIKKDQFYTATKRNKLIREACRALKGHCRSLEKTVSSEDKRKLGKALYSLAPKSLGDPQGIGVIGSPEVCSNCMGIFKFILTLLHIFSPIGRVGCTDFQMVPE